MLSAIRQFVLQPRQLMIAFKTKAAVSTTCCCQPLSGLPMPYEILDWQMLKLVVARTIGGMALKLRLSESLISPESLFKGFSNRPNDLFPIYVSHNPQPVVA